MSLFSDPVGWARIAAGSRLRLTLAIVLHISACLLFSLYRVPKAPDAFLSPVHIGAIFFLGGYFPIVYLYAIYRLLRRGLTSDPDNGT